MSAPTWSPSDKATLVALTNGDLTATNSSSTLGAVRATEGYSSGKWYWECECEVTPSTSTFSGVGESTDPLNFYPGYAIGGCGYYSKDGKTINSNSWIMYGDFYTTGDVIGYALDMDNGKIWWSKNGVWQASGDPGAGTNEAYSGLSGTKYPMVGIRNSGSTTLISTSADLNYSTPSGFNALDYVPTSTSYTAKSVIIDIADIWGGTTYAGLRSVDFFFEGNKIGNIETTDFAAYATAEYSASYRAELAFDTALSKTGNFISQQWLASSGNYINQRLICVFNTETVFDEIRINNSHNSGGITNSGAKTVEIHTSSDSITSTVYNEAISNSSKIFDGTFDGHTTSNIEDEQTLTLIAPFASISGTITEDGTAVARLVRAYNQSDGSFIAETTSNATTGAYSIEVGSATAVFVVAFDDGAGTVYNAVILDQITP